MAHLPADAMMRRGSAAVKRREQRDELSRTLMVVVAMVITLAPTQQALGAFVSYAGEVYDFAGGRSGTGNPGAARHGRVWTLGRRSHPA